jgi:hypothetical protein
MEEPDRPAGPVNPGSDIPAYLCHNGPIRTPSENHILRPAASSGLVRGQLKVTASCVSPKPLQRTDHAPPNRAGREIRGKSVILRLCKILALCRDSPSLLKTQRSSGKTLDIAIDARR